MTTSLRRRAILVRRNRKRRCDPMGSTSTPRIPTPWLQYIANAARRYATGVLHADDLRQIGCVTYILARQRYLPDRGPFEPYAKAAVKNAMIKARQAEQRHYDLPANAAIVSNDEDGDPWAAENRRVDEMASNIGRQLVKDWTQTLNRQDLIVVEGVFYDEASQRDLAVRLGVTQARISQRKKALLARAVTELAAAKKYLN
jgi:RNA polymerase sigma factor (sigma-70 family)